MTDAERMRRPLPRSVILLGWVSFFADVSSEMMYPLLPLFVVGVLGAPATALGAIEGVAMAAVALLTALSGWRSDRTRRRVTYIRYGHALPVLGKSLLAVATVWPMVLAGRSIDRVGKGLRASPRDALIADLVEPDQRGRAFGFHRALDTAGALAGVLLSAALFYWLSRTDDEVEIAAPAAPGEGTLRIIFGVAAALGLASLALTFLVKDPEPIPVNDITKPENESPAHGRGDSTCRFSRSFWTILVVLIVFSLANSSDAFLLLRAGHVGLSPLMVIFVYAVYNLSYALTSYPAGILSDRFGRWRMIAAGWIIYALVYAGFAAATEWSVWPLMAFYGCYMALTEGVGKALIADHAPPQRRATAMGVLHMATGLSVLAGSIFAGWLWDRFGAPAPFWFGAAGAALALILLLALRPLLRDPGDITPSLSSRRRGDRPLDAREKD